MDELKRGGLEHNMLNIDAARRLFAIRYANDADFDTAVRLASEIERDELTETAEDADEEAIRCYEAADDYADVGDLPNARQMRGMGHAEAFRAATLRAAADIAQLIQGGE